MIHKEHDIGMISRHSHPEISLFEMGSSMDSRVEMVSSMLNKAQARCKQMQAHQFFMSRNTRGLENHLLTLAEVLSSTKPKAKVKAKGVSVFRNTDTSEKSTDIEDTESTEAMSAGSQVNLVQESDADVADPKAEPAADNAAAAKSKETADLNKLVDSFIESQSGADDACHSKLFEARHQLNQLHDILTTLLTQVNATENSLILYDKELQEKLRELQEIEAWKSEELKKCKIKKEADEKMFTTLTAELKEMHQIANPSTAMNLANGTVSHAKEEEEEKEEEEKAQISKRLSFLQERAEGMRQQVSLLQENVSSRNPYEAAARVPALVKSTQDAARHFLVCAAKYQGPSSLLQEAQDPNATSKGNATSASPASPASPDPNATSKGNAASPASPASASPAGPASPDECKKQKETLEKTYVKAYVELARLTAEYSELVKSTACEDNVNSVYEERAPSLQESAEKLSKLSSDTADELKELRPRLESAVEADAKLRKQVEELTEECENLPETVSDLDKVRDAIGALSLCPGLERPEFKMPRWIGKWVVFSQDAKKQDDKQQDAGMNWACNHAVDGSRAAESSEIQERTILEMPVNNTGEFPLMGGCPNCAGDDDTPMKDGHDRNCWFRGKPLNEEGMTGLCATGRKVILCVSDGADIRKIPGEH
jgi:hypothetical protein